MVADYVKSRGGKVAHRVTRDSVMHGWVCFQTDCGTEIFMAYDSIPDGRVFKGQLPPNIPLCKRCARAKEQEAVEHKERGQ